MMMIMFGGGGGSIKRPRTKRNKTPGGVHAVCFGTWSM